MTDHDRRNTHKREKDYRGIAMKRPSQDYLEQKTWEQKAQQNPLYAVMSHEEFAESGREPTVDELIKFYRRGDEMVQQWILPWLAETKTTPSMQVLEFGCGMGRLVKALANAHNPDKVFGVDISQTMIEHARRNVTSGASFAVVLEGGLLPYDSECFDRIYSYAVFQHISTKSVLLKSIRELARILKPGGRLKLNFEMPFGPPFEDSLRHDTFALERRFVVYGWTRRWGLPVWGAKIWKANNWQGIRLGYSQIIKELRHCGIRTYGIVREPSARGLIWFHGEKTN